MKDSVCRAAGVALLASGLGCVHALHEPPPLSQLATPQTRPASPEEVDALLRQGEILYATRSLAGVRQAVESYLQAAQADATRIDGLLGAVRSQVWLVDHDPDADARRAEAIAAVQSAQWCLRIAPASVPCQYWQAAALGMQARERSTTALDALPRIEELFKKAAQGDPEMEDAGPNRALALLYARAPGWPAGPGDPDRALSEARKAVSLRPKYPPNQLALAEALNLTGDHPGARAAYALALDLAKQRQAAGDPDASDWIAEAEKALRDGSAKH